jgi:sporulation protein YlmC with PRC-barrel domain
MKPTANIKIVSQLLDLPIVDGDGRWCGVVDDVEFSGTARKEARLAALLVGPGAYRGRMPGWMFAVTRAIVGERIVHVPIDEVKTIGSSVELKCSAEKLGLARTDDKLRPWIPKWGAL